MSRVKEGILRRDREKENWERSIHEHAHPSQEPILITLYPFPKCKFDNTAFFCILDGAQKMLAPLL